MDTEPGKEQGGIGGSGISCRAGVGRERKWVFVKGRERRWAEGFKFQSGDAVWGAKQACS